MKILIVSSSFPPLNSTASLRPYSWAKYWTLQDCDVTVLTSQKEQDPSQMVYLPNPGFKVVEVPLPPFIRSLQKRDDEAMLPFYSKSLQVLGKSEPWDIVISTAGSSSAHLIAHSLKKKGLANCWIADYQSRDTHHYIFPLNLLEKKIESKILQRADLISTTTRSLAEDLKRTFNLKKVEVIENGFDPEDLNTLPTSPIFINDGKFRIVHTGSIHPEKRDPTALFQAILNLKQDPDHRHLLDNLEIIFAGANLESISERVSKLEIGSCVKTLDLVNRQDALRMQRDAHTLLFLPSNVPNNDDALSAKIFEYLFSRTPIICIGNEKLVASQLLVMEAKAGQSLLNADEIKAFLIKNLSLVEKKHNQPNLEYLQRYTREALADQLLNLVKDYVPS